jgi:hypothetical protein
MSHTKARGGSRSSKRGTKLAGERVGARRGAVDEANRGRAPFGQAVRHRACPTAGADDHDRPAVGSPVRLLLQDALDEAIPVVVAARQRSVPSDDDAADGANAPRHRVDLVHHGKGSFLVRNGEVTAREAQGG